MTSNHYAMAYGHDFNWLILIGISLAGALIRVWFVARHKGTASPLPIIVAIIILAGIAVAIAPRATAGVAADVSFDAVRSVIHERCTTCHAADPAHPGFPAPPLGVAFDTDEQIVAAAEQIYVQTVVTEVMPISNLTMMTDEERQLIADWYHARGAAP